MRLSQNSIGKRACEMEAEGEKKRDEGGEGGRNGGGEGSGEEGRGMEVVREERGKDGITVSMMEGGREVGIYVKCSATVSESDVRCS